MRRARLWMIFWGLAVTSSLPAISHQEQTNEAAAPAQCMRIATFPSLGVTANTTIKPVIQKMYRIAGLCLETIDLHSERSAELLRNGEIDGETARVAVAIQNMTDYAVRVPQPMFRINLQFTWLNGQNFDGSMLDLRGKKVGLIRGERTVHDLIRPYAEHIIPLTDLSSAAELLERGRINILATNSLSQVALQQQFPARNTPLRYSVFNQVNVYHVLHLRHADKAERLALALKTMIRTGSMKLLDERYGIYPAEISQK